MIAWTKVIMSCLCLWELLLVRGGVKNLKVGGQMSNRSYAHGDERERHANVEKKGMFN